MGVVYKDEDTDLGRFVALKFLPDDLARDQQALVRGLSAGRRDSWVYVALSQAYVCLTRDYGWCRSAYRGRIAEGQDVAHGDEVFASGTGLHPGRGAADGGQVPD